MLANSNAAYADRSIGANAGISEAGRNLPVVLNTVLSGFGTPSASIGHNGDFYLDRKVWQFFGPKAKGSWPLPVPLVGPVGSPGLIGAIGPQGKPGLKGEAGLIGAAGNSTMTAGSAGPMGPSGPAGLAGAMGSAGPSGPAGSSGLAGASGPSGATGSTGSTGSPGPMGATGPQGLQGNAGVAGPTGSVGPRGPSRTISGSLSFPAPISGAAGSTANSTPFGGFSSGSKYSVMMVVEVWTASNPFSSPSTSISVSSTLGSPVLSLWQSSSVGLKLVGNSTISSTVIHSNAIVDGSGLSGGFSLVLTVTDRDGTVGAPATLDGYYVATEVDALT